MLSGNVAFTRRSSRQSVQRGNILPRMAGDPIPKLGPSLMIRPLKIVAIAALAASATPVTALAQYGTPPELRVMTPTIRDAEPGAMPAPEAKVLTDTYRRQPVFYRSNEAPGTIVIDTSHRFLYLLQANNTALRYGIGVGRDGFQWNGLLKITRKAE